MRLLRKDQNCTERLCREPRVICYCCQVAEMPAHTRTDHSRQVRGQLMLNFSMKGSGEDSSRGGKNTFKITLHHPNLFPGYFLCIFFTFSNSAAHVTFWADQLYASGSLNTRHSDLLKFSAILDGFRETNSGFY
jgi:hypothetical protein